MTVLRSPHWQSCAAVAVLGSALRKAAASHCAGAGHYRLSGVTTLPSSSLIIVTRRARMRVCCMAFSRRLCARLFIWSTQISQIIKTGLEKSNVLVLLQTKRVLERPWVLLELCTALRQEIPIVCVQIKGLGYDFGETKVYLENLEVELERRNPGALKELTEQLNLQAEARGDEPDDPRAINSVSKLSQKLAKEIPAIISIPFDPEGSEAHLTAVAREVVMRMAQAVKHPALARQGTEHLSKGMPSKLEGATKALTSTGLESLADDSFKTNKDSFSSDKTGMDSFKSNKSGKDSCRTQSRKARGSKDAAEIAPAPTSLSTETPPYEVNASDVDETAATQYL